VDDIRRRNERAVRVLAWIAWAVDREVVVDVIVRDVATGDRVEDLEVDGRRLIQARDVDDARDVVAEEDVLASRGLDKRYTHERARGWSDDRCIKNKNCVAY
jgi:hypothetical protein